jgi:dTDP-4-amino-4,6-dideoxygalactose transaminase
MKNNEDFLRLFEDKLSKYTGAPHVVVVDRCTNAIFLSLLQFGKQSITIPKNTYLSVPMTLINMGYDVSFRDEAWEGCYQIGNTPVWDCAVGFHENMYISGQIQCLSFQQKKRLPIGKGGAILLDDAIYASLLRRLRHDGRVSDWSVAYEMEINSENILLGYHMNMSPDEAAKGVLLMNQLNSEYVPGTWKDYPDISTLRCFV